MLVDEVRTRIEAKVEELNRRTQGAAELTELIRAKQLPQSPVFAFVIPLGLRPRSEGEAGTGFFTQMVDETIGIILVINSMNDPTGGRSLPKVDELVASLIEKLCGWGPEEAIGVFRLASGNLVSVEAGTVFYQLDIAIQSQIRNTGA